MEQWSSRRASQQTQTGEAHDLRSCKLAAASPPSAVGHNERETCSLDDFSPPKSAQSQFEAGANTCVAELECLRKTTAVCGIHRDFAHFSGRGSQRGRLCFHEGNWLVLFNEGFPGCHNALPSANASRHDQVQGKASRSSAEVVKEYGDAQAINGQKGKRVASGGSRHLQPRVRESDKGRAQVICDIRLPSA
jgi:hypothetical protein